MEQSQRHRTSRLPLWVLLLLMLGGCSVNSTGFKPFFTADTPVALEGGTYESYDAWGFHLYTKGAVGLHIGRLSRGLLYPELTQAPGACMDQLLGTETTAHGGETARGKPTGAARSGVPVHIRSDKVGIGFELTRFALRVNFGAHKRHETRLRSDASALIWIESDAADGLTTACALMQPENGANHDH